MSQQQPNDNDNNVQVNRNINDKQPNEQDLLEHKDNDHEEEQLNDHHNQQQIENEGDNELQLLKDNSNDELKLFIGKDLEQQQPVINDQLQEQSKENDQQKPKQLNEDEEEVAIVKSKNKKKHKKHKKLIKKEPQILENEKINYDKQPEKKKVKDVPQFKFRHQDMTQIHGYQITNKIRTATIKNDFEVCGIDYDTERLGWMKLLLGFSYKRQATWQYYWDIYEKVDEEHRSKIEMYCKKYLKDYSHDKIVTAFRSGGASVNPSSFNQQKKSKLRDSGVDRGWYYSNKSNQVQTFTPEKVNFDSQWFIGSRDQRKLDCVAHAINYAVGFPWFQNRQQVVRLQKENNHRDSTYTKQYKERNGISLTTMKNCVYDGQNLYSLESLYEWKSSVDDTFAQGALELLEKHPQKTFLLLYTWNQVVLQYQHCVTVKKCDDGFALMDSAKDRILYTDPQDEFTLKWNIRDFIKSVWMLQIWAFEKQRFKKDEDKQKKLTRLRYLMTEKIDEQEEQKDITNKAKQKKRRKTTFTNTKKAQNAKRQRESQQICKEQKGNKRKC